MGSPDWMAGASVRGRGRQLKLSEAAARNSIHLPARDSRRTGRAERSQKALPRSSFTDI